MAGEEALGRACYEAFGETGAPWESLSEETRERWAAAGEAAGEKFMQQEGFVFDPLSYRWTRSGGTGPAISPRTTGA